MGNVDPVVEILLRHYEDQGKELRQISSTLAAVAVQLKHGAEVHQETATVLKQHATMQGHLHSRVLVLEKTHHYRQKRTSTTLAEWTELLKAFWPYLAIIAVITGKVVWGWTEPWTQLIGHLGPK